MDRVFIPIKINESNANADDDAVNIDSTVLANIFTGLVPSQKNRSCYRYWIRFNITSRNRLVCAEFSRLVRLYRNTGRLVLVGDYVAATFLKSLIYQTIFAEYYNWPYVCLVDEFGGEFADKKVNWYNWYVGEYQPSFKLRLLESAKLQ